jgi:hypothetical protein
MRQGLKQSLLLLLWQLLQLQRMMTKMSTLTQMMQMTKMMNRTIRLWKLMPWIQKKTKMPKRMELKTPWLRLMLLLRCYSTIQHGRVEDPAGAWAAAAAESAPTDGIDDKEEDGATELDEAEGESWA